LLVPLSIYMRAQELDLLAHISWQLCGDNSAAHPASLADKYRIGDAPTKESFADPDDFEAYRARIFAQGGE